MTGHTIGTRFEVDFTESVTGTDALTNNSGAIGNVSTFVIENVKTTDTEIQNWLNSLTVTHVIEFGIIRISNTMSRLILVYT